MDLDANVIIINEDDEMDLPRAFQACIDKFGGEEGDRHRLQRELEEIAHRIDILGVFSRNEQLEDLSTNSIKFLLIDWYLGAVLEETPSPQSRAPSSDRVASLEAAQSRYQRFLHYTVNLYEIASPETKDLLDRAARVGHDALQRRAVKIDRFRRMQLLEEEEEASIGRMGESNEDTLRQHWIKVINLHILRASQSLEQITDELNLLGEKQSQSPPHPSSSIFSKTPAVTRITQPFTLLSTRQQIAATVFRPDHTLPTMTIDEYLEMERRRGGILDGPAKEQPGKQEEDDPDRMTEEEEHRVLLKTRQFDKFKDENPRGSGNTFNRS